ncbi:hypothetical protein LZK73_18475 [Neorhizobium galegae]|nr:hypothetical protein LZK73_18475 [Neorhizobium galegae]
MAVLNYTFDPGYRAVTGGDLNRMIETINTAFSQQISPGIIGQPNGLATLDGNGKVPVAQIPAAASIGAVDLTTAQTIAAVKTFGSSPIVPVPSGGTDAANKNYVDAQIIIVNDNVTSVTAPITGVTPGTAANSKALIVDATRGITGFRDTRATPVFKQGAPAAKTATVTLTAAELMTGLIVGTPVAAAIYTLPLATALETALIAAYPGLAADDSFEFSVINLGGAGFTITMATAAGWTLSGQLVIEDGSAAANRSAATFRVRRTAANAYTLYRVN